MPGWRLIVALVLSLAAASWSRPASAEAIALGPPCTLATDSQATPAQVLARDDAFNCHDRYAYTPGRVNWAVFANIAAEPRPSDPWNYRQSLGRERSHRVFAVYADGVIAESPTSMQGARQSFASADVIFALPPRDSAITAILVRVENMQAIRGLAPRADLVTTAELNAGAKNYHLFWGLFFGLIGAILVFNFTLFLVMRHRFQLIYCLFATSALAFAFSWSGGVFLLFPDLTTYGQVRCNVFAISACILAAPAFFLAFVEAGMVSPAMRRAIWATAPLPLIVTLARAVAPDAWWHGFDLAFYSLMILSIALTSLASILAWRRGSLAVRFIILGWSVPYALVFVRGLWAMNGISLHTGLFDLSPFIAIAYEAIVSAIGMGWRIREMRRERDEARGREGALRTLAETDPLTGLLNRRAFLERACAGDHVKGLALFDIDHFKSINDRFGHDVGDQVIAAFATLIGDKLPPGGVAGRMGGEEFAVVVPGSGAEAFARLICKAAARLAWTPDGSAMTVSAGSVTATIVTEPEWRRAYIAADAALLDAKRDGRNRVVAAKTALAA